MNRCRRAFVAAALMAAAADALAQGNAVVVGSTLAVAGAVGGAAFGVLAALADGLRVRLWPSFGVYLGLLCAVASTRFGSMEVIPLTLALGAGFGVLPYALAFLALRAGAGRMRAWLTRPPA